ncbi:hypothetical protein [Caldimonas thermodepolymerans]|uniref:Uncharacterized protein n=1 Tax=Caldimonas thermodepolymerans TaxID=215580 RepID=A0AA46HX67_9BURK|nr:hypothetical protein [Caldimonas thermodepolymerans]TCP09619.1 hypothetical protein EV676_101193 [Caldimonas thermodepolymerans]UZG49635.1 hypothetical protein ONS87_08455 [Caldimonas thermodepolymerans]
MSASSLPPAPVRPALPGGFTLAVAGATGADVQALCAGLRERLAPGTAWQVLDVTEALLEGAAAALPAPARCLLAGLDVLPPAQRPAAEALDQRLREALQRTGWSYGVVYGRTPAERLEAACRLLAPPSRRPGTSSESTPRLRPWCCPECLVPECEHRLFRLPRQVPRGHWIDDDDGG